MEINASSTGPPEEVKKSGKSSPTLLSPRWFWAVFVALLQVFRPQFWKDLKDPDKQAVWQVSSAVTIANVTGATAAYHWVELNAPWLIKAIALLGNAIKAIVSMIVAFVMAVWNVATNS